MQYVSTRGTAPTLEFEDVVLAGSDSGGALAGRVELVERLGERTIVYLLTDIGEVRASMRGACPFAAGDAAHVSFPHPSLHIFGADGARL